MSIPSSKNKPSQIDLNRAETLLAMGLKDYTAMRKEADQLAKSLLVDKKGIIKHSGKDFQRLQTLVHSLQTADQDIQDQLEVFRNVAEQDSKKVSHSNERAKDNLSKLLHVVKKLEGNGTVQQDLVDDVETAQGAGITALMETQSQWTRMILLLMTTLVIIGATVIAVFKPEYMWVAKGISAICMLYALYELVVYLGHKFL